jgi:soluble epoxide hydrolase / lipid-phosphate phosphatase
VFVAAASKDYICVAGPQIAIAEKFCPNSTIKEYDSGHWVIWSHADKLNQDLLAWMEALPTEKAAL